MAASAVAAPLPPGDVDALWREQKSHQADSRALARDLADAAVTLAVHLRAKRDAVSPAEFDRWTLALGFPPATVRSLLQRLEPRPALPAATLEPRSGRLTVRLAPQHAAIARAAALEAVKVPGFAPARDFVDTLVASTQDPLREYLRSIRNRLPDEFNPEKIAALAPLVIPASALAPGPDLYIPSPPTDAQAAAQLARYRDLHRAQRRASRRAARRSRALGRLLWLQQQELASTGRASRFSSYLRQHHIPRATAYRLIADYARSAGLAPGNCLTFARPTPAGGPESAPELELRTEEAVFHCNPQETVLAFVALDGLLAAKTPFDLSSLVAETFCLYLAGPAKRQILHLWDAPPDSFSPPRFLPRLRLGAHNIAA